MAIYTNKSKSNQNLDKSLKFKVGISLTVIFSLFLINLVFNILKPINSFLLGSFGLFTYAIFIGLIIVGVLLILNKSFSINSKDLILSIIWLFLFLCILQCITTLKLDISNYKNYLVESYNYKLTAGGIIFSIFSYPLIGLTHTFVNPIVIFSIALIIDSSFLIIRFYDYFKINNLKTVQSNSSTIENDLNLNSENDDFKVNENKVEPIVDDSIFIEDEEIEKLERENKITELTTTEKDKIKAKNILGLNRFNNEDNNTNYNDDSTEHQTPNINDIFKATENVNSYEENRPPKYVHDTTTVKTKNKKKTLSDRDKKNLEYLRVITGRPLEDENDDSSYNEQNTSSNQTILNNQIDNNEIDYSSYEIKPKSNKPKMFVDSENNEFINNLNNLTNRENIINDSDDIYDENLTINNYNNSNVKPQTFRKPPIIKENIEEEINNNPIQTSPINRPMAQMVMGEVASEKHMDNPKYKKPYHYNRPPIDLLNYVHNDTSNDSTENTLKGQALEDTLASFKTPAKIVSIKRGPTFSRFEMQMQQGTGITVNKVTNYVNDIAMAVRSNGKLRLEIPIPGKSTFGIEVPNEKVDIVGIRDIIESNNFNNSKSPLTFALGKGITGEAEVAKLDKLVHLLVAGATGSGKSVCLNSILISLLYHASPEDVKLILVDPKQVEFTAYQGIPHLLIPNIITDPEKTILMLEWVCNEMERRYTLLSKNYVKNIKEYNDKQEVKNGILEKLPYLVVMLDEVGDLILTHKKDVEDKLIRLGQKARAAGIHMILATQRPTVDVITGTIKANLPSRIAFAVTSVENSRAILGCGGAESLLGRGDMLFSDQTNPDLKRMQGTLVTDEEIFNVVNYIKENNECIFDSEIEEEMFNPKTNSFNDGYPNEQPFDPLLKRAVRTVYTTNRSSISGLQRSLGIGYPKAAKLIDQMESAGFISSADSKNNRIIYITPQQFLDVFGEEI